MLVVEVELVNVLLQFVETMVVLEVVVGVELDVHTLPQVV
jgi:hypothetical protein